MSGTVEGGRKAAATNKQRYGLNFYKDIGHDGGVISRGGGFAADRELAVEAGRRGGKASRRSKRGVDIPVVQVPRPVEVEFPPTKKPWWIFW